MSDFPHVGAALRRDEMDTPPESRRKAAPTPSSASQRFVWHGLAMQLPAEWELLQYSRNPEQGRCAFADRSSFRFELSWRRVAGPPDFERMWSDYAAKLRADGEQPGKRLSLDSWQGLHTTRSTRWCCFMEGQGFLVELVFLWPKNRDRAQEHDLLSSFHMAAPGEWCAFGMTWSVPADAALTTCRILPAHATVAFKVHADDSQFTFSRQGMVSSWLKEPMESLLKRRVGGRAKDVATSLRAEAGHDVTTLTLSERTTWRPWRIRHIQSSAWVCPRDGRYYQLTQSAPNRGATSCITLPSRHRCCPEFSCP